MCINRLSFGQGDHRVDDRQMIDPIDYELVIINVQAHLVRCSQNTTGVDVSLPVVEAHTIKYFFPSHNVVCLVSFAEKRTHSRLKFPEYLTSTCATCCRFLRYWYKRGTHESSSEMTQCCGRPFNNASLVTHCGLKLLKPTRFS